MFSNNLPTPGIFDNTSIAASLTKFKNCPTGPANSNPAAAAKTNLVPIPANVVITAGNAILIAASAPPATSNPVIVSFLILLSSSLLPVASALRVSIPFINNHPPNIEVKKLPNLERVNCALAAILFAGANAAA